MLAWSTSDSLLCFHFVVSLGTRIQHPTSPVPSMNSVTDRKHGCTVTTPNTAEKENCSSGHVLLWKQLAATANTSTTVQAGWNTAGRRSRAPLWDISNKTNSNARLKGLPVFSFIHYSNYPSLSLSTVALQCQTVLHIVYPSLLSIPIGGSLRVLEDVLKGRWLWYKFIGLVYIIYNNNKDYSIYNLGGYFISSLIKHRWVI